MECILMIRNRGITCDFSVVVKYEKGVGGYSYVFIRDDGEGWDMNYHEEKILKKYATMQELEDFMLEGDSRGCIIELNKMDLHNAIYQLLDFLCPNETVFNFHICFREEDFMSRINEIVFS